MKKYISGIIFVLITSSIILAQNELDNYSKASREQNLTTPYTKINKDTLNNKSFSKPVSDTLKDPHIFKYRIATDANNYRRNMPKDTIISPTLRYYPKKRKDTLQEEK